MGSFENLKGRDLLLNLDFSILSMTRCQANNLREWYRQQVNFQIRPLFRMICQKYFGLRIAWEEFSNDDSKSKHCRWHLSSHVVAALPCGWLSVTLQTRILLWIFVVWSSNFIFFKHSPTLKSSTLFPAHRLLCWNTTCKQIQERPKCIPG